MPKNAGAQCIRDIQTAHPGTPLIAISGQFRPGLSAGGATAKSLGVQQVIAKPLVRGDLLTAVRGIMGTLK
jgi:CheY-like chemotaxis protein